ncbi:aminodeoxychorismate synthase component I [Halarcobacter anaerophilus]|uniref:Aminodeoxychorismate synthase component I n=1 Tax=Halarcobacter anaerophilus TaxID=877500 RepID=A0A4V1LQ13_9BACT|nr:aminodeoxychorismate synthase component I [Halarcobacter anaerophilus]QDF30052.1 aminodeoxychorismate synthase, component I [Halarcobacter anaerophilus]RXJ63098.1 aminodeoxychorismate synthase component I [Halarcobacter anaerophilus]
MNLKKQLNRYGSLKEPFLFIISYDLSKFYIKPLKDLPCGIKLEVENNIESKKRVKKELKKYPLSFEKYKEKFDFIQEHIKRGNSYLLNLTAKTEIKTDLSLDEIYQKAKSKYKLKFFDDFVCFSPETFIKIENNKIFTFPMKGTIDSKISNAKEKILANEKEMAEHTMVVDLLRNDLGIVSNKIRVEKFRYIDKINAGNKELLQVSSKISGVLDKNWNEKIGDILTSILPAGSITGTPKKRTVDILKKIEGYDREFYSGVFGVYDGENLNSAVMIRFIQKDEKGNLFYKSGGGITCDSDVNQEYEELLDKVYLPF